MHKLFIDIETIPGQSPAVMEELKAEAEAEKAACKAPANYKDPEKIAANIAEQHAAIDAALDQRYRKTSFDGAFGQVVVIGLAVDDGDPVSIYSSGLHMESSLLKGMSEVIGDLIKPSMHSATLVVGHNVSAFDLRFLVQRSIVCGVRPHPIIARAAAAKPWEVDRVYDTMVQWSGAGNRIKLDKLARALGLPGKGDFDGSKVWDAVKAGEIARVAEYCKDDVRMTRNVYRRMTFEIAPQPVEFDDVTA